MRERRQPGQYAGARDPAVRGQRSAARPRGIPRIPRRGRARSAGSRPPAPWTARCHRIDRGEPQRDQPAVAPNSSSATSPISPTVIVPSTAWAIRAPWIAPSRRTSWPSIRSTAARSRDRRAGSRRLGPSCRRRRARAVAERVIAGVRDLAGQRQVRAGVVDRVVVEVACTSATRRPNATTRIAAATAGLAARLTARRLCPLCGERQWIPTIPAQTQFDAPAPPFQIRLATASCSDFEAR